MHALLVIERNWLAHKSLVVYQRGFADSNNPLFIIRLKKEIISKECIPILRKLLRHKSYIKIQTDTKWRFEGLNKILFNLL